MNLRKVLKTRKLATAGKKASLIDRIIEDLKKEHGITRDCSVSLVRYDSSANKEEEKTTTTKQSESMGQSISKVSTSVPIGFGAAAPQSNSNGTVSNILTSTKTGNRAEAQTTHSMTLRKRPNAQVTLPAQCSSTNSFGAVTSTSSALHSSTKLTSPQPQSSITNRSHSHRTTHATQLPLSVAVRSLSPVSQSSQSTDALPEKKVRKTIDVSAHKQKNKRKPKNVKKIASTAMMLRPALRKNEMVWAHIKGFRNWPGIIEGEQPNGKYTIHFFGDYSTSDVSKSKIMHLMEGFKDYANAKKPTALLLKAITEAQMFILDKNQTECPICKMMEVKKTLRHSEQI